MADGGMAKALNERISAVADAPTEDFGELLKLAGLDPARHLRFQEWSGSIFAGNKLEGCDFTGARMLGCDFTGALITGARFDQAEIDSAANAKAQGPKWGAAWGSSWGRSTQPRTNLRAAADWDAYVAGWRRPARLIGDAHLPVGAVFQDAPFAPELVVVPPGEFMMGSPPDEPGREEDEGPRHLVTILGAFAVGRYAVTFEEWDFAQADKAWPKITGRKAREPDDEGWGRGNRPVIDVSWEDAQAYVKWLSAKTGRGYRLLSEAEWEYVARAGTATPFWWGTSITPAQANYVYEGGGEKGEYPGKTAPVDHFAPNPFGLYQVHGNVWEWVEDVRHDSYADDPPSDGSAWTIGDRGRRVLRGGSRNFLPQFLRAAHRITDPPVVRFNDTGFRVSRTLNP